MITLAFETSCDETAVAVLRGGREVLSSVVASQTEFHAPYRGVVPEIACRKHVEFLTLTLEEAIRKAGVRLADIDLVAATSTPGLVNALLIGLTAAKTAALALDVPLIGVNHVEAHLAANLLTHAEVPYPAVGLVVSGGHTILYSCEDPASFEFLGSTVDDAAGEAYDKAASVLGLPYPGGPFIDRLARAGRPGDLSFPRSRLGPDSLDFSFSGLKTAVLYHCRGRNAQGPARTLSEQETADVCREFQEAVVDVLVEKTLRAAFERGVSTVLLGGGVACNSRLRERFAEAAKKKNLAVLFPEPRYCTDNAAMIACLGRFRFERGERSPLDIDVAGGLVRSRNR